MIPVINNDCLGVVLAGGMSSRMGKDKAKLHRNNNSMLSMLEFSKQVLSESGISNIIVSGDNYDVPDTVKKCGPVGGIFSVLSKFPQAKSLLLLPVDLPFMTAQALTNLRLKGELSQKATYFEGHSIPLYLPNNAYVTLFLAQAFTVANSEIGLHKSSERFSAKSGKTGPSIKALLKQVPHQAIQSSDANILFNTNTPQEWLQAKKQLIFS